ncbi:hypothetical protein DCAR_0311142 [Daucus carota subsp. sativus]|uniref:Uncharacterized protein n=1 Tax=Daucus carota subsp. sativus TaxID=79200 RepID=A0A162AHE7_DAUCS|nr:hypothetical protein DCAR_0311142 [Daucus carota subsp. sativus]
MSTNKVHSKGQQVQVPFAWENKPGFRKEDTSPRTRNVVTDGGDYDDKEKCGGKTKLPPPPYLQSESGRASPVKLQNIPLPPCAYPSPIWTSGSKRDAYKEDDDPFLIAYRKCTTGATTRRLLKKKMSSVSTLSCKHSCSVSDDSIVRISQLSIPRPTKEIIGSLFKFDD